MAYSTAKLDRKSMAEIFKKNGTLLLGVIKIEPEFVTKLEEHDVISSSQAETVQAIEKPDRAKQYLFDIIKAGKVENFISFCIVLHDDMGRDDIVCEEFGLDIFNLKQQKQEIQETREKRNKGQKEQKQEQPRKESPAADNGTAAYKKLTYDDVKQLLIDHKTALYERFDPTPSVLAELRKAEVITSDTEDKLNADGITPIQKKKKILEVVEMKGITAFLPFCVVVCHKDIGQEHLVKEVLGLNIDDIRKQINEQ